MSAKTNHEVQLIECIEFAKEMCRLDETDKQYIAGLVNGIIYSKKKETKGN
ncbi:hypothetical protein [Clostridium perfringens]|uniref:hypothetical protein n=1 Tax=Clostridium phage phiSM101 TaxID=396359 RepID=UPI0000DB682C|nr:hypothetical protein [Clostridium perfringens]YP_699965.1 hypothetical protein CPR_C0037 [Clostridium phage phiSM101]ABG87917.1 hypothetical protein CPR_C0037 [Clostridium phage phiSM101]EHA6441872.1 hypothetical protein [Clostridium perfringens]MBI6033719.1 hypothetical protein [Clostridium perfringens]MCH1961315.1 hypothetical protein [Clostridium perfringens]MDK3122624.1 hypothetical protein [Clostridium perfringens]